ncbi:MAG TPA: TonB-dependent receptor, partial [Polyangiaceae bacterium]|nr:TonB-dependent receptor [Polyangiaceae bacterium]
TVASTVISGAALEAPGTSSADVLARVPGVQVNRTGAQSDLATASIRGADAAQVPVYLAGIRLNDDVSGTADLSAVPLFMIERVEVYRGNAPLKSDRLGLGGAIFFWPRLPQETRALIGAEVGSFGARAGWVSAEVGDSQVGSIVALRSSAADNDYPFVDDRGQRFDLDERQATRANADFEQHDVWAISRYRFPGGVSLTSVISGLQREQGVTGLSVIPAEQARASTRRILVGQSAALPCSNDDSCRLELDTSLLAADVVYDDPALELPALRAYMLDNQGARVTTGAALHQALPANLALDLRASFSFENLKLDRSGALSQRGSRRSLTPAAGLRWHALPNWLWHGVASLECHATEGTAVNLDTAIEQRDSSCDPSEPLGRLGTSYKPFDKLELLGNVGRYERVPTLSELYGSSVFSVGNPSLEAERGTNVDVGLRASYSAPAAGALLLGAEAFAFARTVENLIRYRRTSSESTAPFNVSEARVLGAELAAAVDAFDHVRLEATATLLDSRETTDDPVSNPTPNEVLPLSSRLTASTLLEGYAESCRLFDRAAAGVRYSHRSARFADLAGQTVLPAQHFVDLEASAAFFDRRLLARASVLNLLDAKTTDLIGLPAPGRSYHGAVDLWF